MQKRIFCRLIICFAAMLLLYGTSALADIGKGDKNDAVRDVQVKLIELGYLSGSADGVFGPNTENAVIAFQQAEGLNVSGIVDSLTFQRLENPTVYPPFAKQAKLSTVSIVEYAGAGNNGKTNWALEAEIPMQKWMDGQTPVVKASWTEDVKPDVFDTSKAWEDAKRGLTSSYSFVYTDAYSGLTFMYLDIMLPDDPNLEGRRWIEINIGEQTAIAYFNLTYKGNYFDGKGWAVSDVTFEDMGGVKKSDKNEQTNSTAPSLAALCTLEAVAPFEDNGVGNNGNTVWRLDLNIPQKFWMNGALPKINLSWTKYPVEDVTEDASLGNVWDSAKRGRTSYRCFEWSGLVIYELYLPDDPTLEGRRWMEINFHDRSAIIFFNLTYAGNYSNGRGWELEDVVIEDID